MARAVFALRPILTRLDFMTELSTDYADFIARTYPQITQISQIKKPTQLGTETESQFFLWNLRNLQIMELRMRHLFGLHESIKFFTR